MRDLTRKYAKDLNVGDKINGHEKGWIEVRSVKMIPLTFYTEVLFEGMETPKIVDSHELYDVWGEMK